MFKLGPLVRMGNAGPFPCTSNEEQDFSSDGTTSSQKQCEPKSNLFTQQIPSGIQIKGAVGIFSDFINTYFFETGQIYNGRMLYRTFSKKATSWLRVRYCITNTKE